MQTLPGAWAGGKGFRLYFFRPYKFLLLCVLCHIAPICHFAMETKMLIWPQDFIATANDEYNLMTDRLRR